jgi:hypothetical protein
MQMHAGSPPAQQYGTPNQMQMQTAPQQQQFGAQANMQAGQPGQTYSNGAQWNANVQPNAMQAGYAGNPYNQSQQQQWSAALTPQQEAMRRIKRITTGIWVCMIWEMYVTLSKCMPVS